jgi:choline-glycine betaine transporter
VDAIIARTTNEKIEEVVNYLWGVAISYEAVLVLINVILAFREGASLVYALTLLLICFLPALSAAMYGLHRREVMNQLARERQSALEQKEKERQERRADRKEAQELKLKYAKDLPGLELEQPNGNGKFRGRKS